MPNTKSLALIALISCGTVFSSFARSPSNDAAPVIYSASVDVSSSSIVVLGSNFGSAMPSVQFGSQLATIQEHSPTKVVAKLSQKPQAATYRLILTNAQRKTEASVIHVHVAETNL